jgi:hypothetical protein
MAAAPWAAWSTCSTARCPPPYPQKGYEGSAELRANTGAREGRAPFSLTGGAGNLAVHVEGVARDAGDYRVGKGWAPDGDATRKVPGSFNRTDTGSVGLSWVGERGYLGAAYTRQTAKYGLPGHNHSFDGCHTHGDHLHCGAHGEDDGHDHGDEGEHGDVPVVDLRSERFDVRGELRNPFARLLGPAPARGRHRLRSTTRSKTAPSAPPSRTRPTTPAWSCSTSPSPASRAWSACRPRSASSAPKAKRPTCSPLSPAKPACSCWRNTAWATGALKPPCATTARRPSADQRHRAQPQRHLGIAGRGVEVHARLPGGRIVHPRQPRPVGRRAVRARPAHGHQHVRTRQRRPAL